MYNSQQVERKLLASARLKQLAIAHSFIVSVALKLGIR